MAAARIYQESKSSMQSGKARVGRWVLEFQATVAKRADPLTGWAGSGDTRDQIRLVFPTLEAAQAYAGKYDLEFYVVPAAERSLKLQTYADNFK